MPAILRYKLWNYVFLLIFHITNTWFLTFIQYDDGCGVDWCANPGANQICGPDPTPTEPHGPYATCENSDSNFLFIITDTENSSLYERFWILITNLGKDDDAVQCTCTDPAKVVEFSDAFEYGIEITKCRKVTCVDGTCGDDPCVDGDDGYAQFRE